MTISLDDENRERGSGFLRLQRTELGLTGKTKLSGVQGYVWISFLSRIVPLQDRTDRY